MFEAIIQNIDIVNKILLNTIFISIPEEIYLVMITLIMIGEFDYWKEDECKKVINKWDYSRILTPSVTVAIILNVTRYTNNFTYAVYFVCLFILYILIALTNDILNDARPFKWLTRVFVFLIVGKLTVILTEIVYVPFVLKATGRTMTEIDNGVLLKFLFLLPSRIIQYSILAILFNIRRKKANWSFLTYLVSNKVILLISSFITVFDLYFLYEIYQAVLYTNVITNLTSIAQFGVIISAVIFPMLNISAVLWVAFYIRNKEMNEMKDTLNKLEVISDYLNAYKDEKRYEDITWKLNEIGEAIEEISSGINKTENPNKK